MNTNNIVAPKFISDKIRLDTIFDKLSEHAKNRLTILNDSNLPAIDILMEIKLDGNLEKILPISEFLRYIHTHYPVSFRIVDSHGIAADIIRDDTVFINFVLEDFDDYSFYLENLYEISDRILSEFSLSKVTLNALTCNYHMRAIRITSQTLHGGYSISTKSDIVIGGDINAVGEFAIRYMNYDEGDVYG